MRKRERDQYFQLQNSSLADIFLSLLCLKGSTKSRSWDQVQVPRVEVAPAGAERWKRHKYSDFTWSPCCFSQRRCALLNQELLCLKSPSACRSMAYTRLFKYWSGISHHPSTTCECSRARRLPTFTLHLPVSALNDSLFPNSSWFLMSNPKIPSKTLFVLSPSRATSFPRCLPGFTLTGTACLPPGRQWEWRGLTNTPLTESQCQEATRWKNSKKERVLSRLVAVLLTSSPSPLPCVYANSLLQENTANDTLLKKKKKNQWHNHSLFFSQTLSLTPVVTRSSVADKDWWLNLRRRPAPQMYRMEGVQPWLAPGTPLRGNCAKHTKRCPADLNSAFVTFDSFHNKSERTTEKTGMNGTHMEKEAEGIFIPCHTELFWCNGGLIIALPDTLMST